MSSAPSSGKGLLVSFVGPEAVTAPPPPLGPAVGRGPARCGLRSPLPDSAGFSVVELRTLVCLFKGSVESSGKSTGSWWTTGRRPFAAVQGGPGWLWAARRGRLWTLGVQPFSG